MKREEEQYKNFVHIDDRGELAKEKRKFAENIKQVNKKIPLMFKKPRHRPHAAGIST